MRLFLWLAAAAVAVVDAQQVKEAYGTSYKFPNGLADGTLVTFYVYHTIIDHNFYAESKPVRIDFYDQAVVDYPKQYDITAHIRVDDDSDKPVVSNTFMNGKWGTETAREQPLELYGSAISDQRYWRVDVIKLDNRRLNVFCQGYWSDVRTFEKSLDNIRSVYVSGAVDHNHVQIVVKRPNSNLAPLSFDHFKDFINVDRSDFEVDRKLITFPNFPIGSHIEMSVVLRGSGDAKGKRPTLVFGRYPSFFMKIIQIYKGEWAIAGEKRTHELYIAHSDKWVDDYSRPGWEQDRPDTKNCTNDYTKPNGDLLHLNLTRISHVNFKVNVFYKDLNVTAMQSNPPSGIIQMERDSPRTVRCGHDLPLDLAEQLEQPFDIMSHHGAVILHLVHSIPTAVKN